MTPAGLIGAPHSGMGIAQGIVSTGHARAHGLSPAVWAMTMPIIACCRERDTGICLDAAEWV